MTSEEASRSVLVTGAARGIGKAISSALLSRGHRVTLMDRDASALESCQRELGETQTACYVAGDICVDADCARAVERAVEVFGALHGLVNNAGIGMGSLRADAEINHPPIEELTPPVWHRFFDVNVVGAVRMTREAIGHMKAAGWGRIVVNTTSYYTMHRVQPYGAVKAALESTAAVWAKELDGSGITVNVVVPGGPTDTALVADIDIPRHRLLRPSVMAPPVLWLMSSQSDGVTGRRFVAGRWDASLPPSAAAAMVARPIGWPELAGDVIWAR